MYSADDIFFKEVDDSLWGIWGPFGIMGSVTQGADYLVRLTDGRIFTAPDRAAVLDLLIDVANERITATA